VKQNGGDLKLQSSRKTDKYWVPVVAKTIDVLDVPTRLHIAFCTRWFAVSAYRTHVERTGSIAR
jgi:hypothetical protein